MGKLLPVRHPNRDFFIVDIADASPRDDMASMEHPVFSLAVKPDMRELEYTSSNGNRLRIKPSGGGLATIRDKDILLYCISKLVAQKNAGEKITPYVEASAHEIMVATNWDTGGKSYQRFEEAMLRLRGTTILTDIRTGDAVQTKGFGLVDEFQVDRRDENGEAAPFGRLSKVRIKLSDWTFRAVEANEVLKISAQYFRLRRPLERRLYEIARKHVGTKNKVWRIGIEKLRAKVGTNAPLKKFRFNLKEIIRDGNIPEYGFEIVDDMVIMQRLVPMESLPDYAPSVGYIPLRAATIDRAQKFCHENGLNFGEMEREWNRWANPETMKSADGSFIGFLKQKAGTPGARRLVHARKEAREAHGFEQMQAPQLALGDVEDLDVVSEWDEVSEDQLDRF